MSFFALAQRDRGVESFGSRTRDELSRSSSSRRWQSPRALSTCSAATTSYYGGSIGIVLLAIPVTVLEEEMACATLRSQSRSSVYDGGFYPEGSNLLAFSFQASGRCSHEACAHTGPAAVCCTLMFRNLRRCSRAQLALAG